MSQLARSAPKGAGWPLAQPAVQVSSPRCYHAFSTVRSLLLSAGPHKKIQHAPVERGARADRRTSATASAAADAAGQPALKLACLIVNVVIPP